MTYVGQLVNFIKVLEFSFMIDGNRDDIFKFNTVELLYTRSVQQI